MSVGDIYQSGLQCVTVLIGVFDRISGQPVLGVINQPFHTQHDSRWALEIDGLYTVTPIIHTGYAVVVSL